MDQLCPSDISLPLYGENHPDGHFHFFISSLIRTGIPLQSGNQVRP